MHNLKISNTWKRMQVFKKWWLGLGLGLWSVSALALMPTEGSSNPAYKTFDLKFIQLMEAGQIPGASVVIVKQGSVVYAKAYGYANLENQIPVNLNSEFRLASASKTLTAIGILKLVSEGKLSLSQKVFPYLGLSPLPGESMANGVNSITVQNLLEMSAGWDRLYDPLFGPWPESEIHKYHLPTPMTCEYAARYMMGRPLVSAPGQNFAYANVDYCLLGLVIAKASAGNLSETAYETYMQGLFHSLGANSLHLGSSNIHDPISNEVTYYRLRGATLEASDDDYLRLNDLPYSTDNILTDNYANGGWVASAPDLARIFIGLEQGKLLPRKEMDLLWSVPPGKSAHFTYFKGVQYLKWPYGMGMWRIQDHGRLLFMAHGSFTGTTSMILKKPSGEIDIALFNAKPGYSMEELFQFRQKLIELFDEHA